MPSDPLVGGAALAPGRPAILEPLPGQHVLLRSELLDRRDSVLIGQRAVVAIVDRGHRRDVAGAQALEAPDEQLPVLGGAARPRARRLAERVEETVGAAQPAADVGAD